MAFNLDPGAFKALDANPGGTLELFTKYVDRMELVFDLVFRKADGTPYTPSDKEKKAMLLFRGGDDMKDLFQHVGDIKAEDTFARAVEKIKNGLKARTNSVVQRNLLLANFPQGKKSFERWSKEVANTAQLIDFSDYNWKQATVDAIILQTSNPKLRERALQDNVSYEELLKLGIAKEQSAKGAALLEKASGQTDHSKDTTEEVRRLQKENQRLKARLPKPSCPRCGSTNCSRGNTCPAIGQKCSACSKMNHFAKACRSKRQTKGLNRLSSAEESDSETSGRIVVGKLSNHSSIKAVITITGCNVDTNAESNISLVTDTGVSKTLLNRNDWDKIKEGCKFVKTSKRFRPFGTAYHLPIRGKARVRLTAKKGASIETFVYIVDDKREQSLLGEEDAVALGIVTLNPDGATHATNDDERVCCIPNEQSHSQGIVSGEQTQPQIDQSMKEITKNFPNLFSEKTGRFKGDPIKIHVRPDATPKIQPTRRIPLHYIEKLRKELDEMLEDGIIEGPLKEEEPGTYVSNLVITDKKWDPSKIRVTLDCQQVNKDIFPTHEPIPTPEELRHKLKGSDRFSTIDLTNCYHQFEIEKQARKLFAFRTPWGIYRQTRMVQGTSPASGEVQKKIRETIKDCPHAMNIKDDILIYGTGQAHDKHLQRVLDTLNKRGLTLRAEKCELGKPSVKWFGFIFSKDGMSPDPEKCKVIQEWPEPKSIPEVKSFLQTIQFNAKFLHGKRGEASYPELTKPLRELTKKNSRFKWGQQESEAFVALKNRLCSDNVLVPYDTSLPTRLYVDSSPVGTHATVAQKHKMEDEHAWRPVNHTSRSWTPAEAGYSQIERESNGILTGMYMNRMYTLGTDVEVVNDHKPLLPIYNDPRHPKQLRLDRHRTKLLPFRYTVTYQAGEKTPCDYGSRHPPKKREYTAEEKEKWAVEDETDIFVNRVIEDLAPHAITPSMIRAEISKDKAMQQLREDITTSKHCRNSLAEYRHIFNELSYIDGIILRQDKVLIPSSLQADVIGLAHENHQGEDKTLNLLRESCWFPNMSKMVKDYVKSCLPCNAATRATAPEPLQPNLLPDRPWQKLHADFKGPIGSRYYLHVIIDQFSKYPEVDIVKSTSFSKLEPRMDRIFATHGIPEEISSDNGSPYFSHEMSEYCKRMGIHHRPCTPEDPQSNGFAESFVKLLCKLVHTSIAEGKDPQKELQNYLLAYRSTPHTTTGASPAEMLFGRKIRTKLPQHFETRDTELQKNARDRHDRNKVKQKTLFDQRHKASHKQVNVGDKVLIQQRKTTTNPPFDPVPFNVTCVKGNCITAKRGNQTRTRDKNKVKVLKPRPEKLIPSWEKRTSQQTTDYNNFDIEGVIPQPTTTDQPTGLHQNAVPTHQPIAPTERTDLAEIPHNEPDDQPTELPRHAEPVDETSNITETKNAFSISAEEEETMQALLDSAFNSTTTQDEPHHPTPRVLRSHNTKLQWNSTMNNNPVILTTDSEQ